MVRLALNSSSILNHSTPCPAQADAWRAGLSGGILNEHKGVSRDSEQKFWRGKTRRRRASLARGVRVCPPKFVSKAVKLRASEVRRADRPAMQTPTPG